MAVRDFSVALVQLATESRSKDHADTHPQTDAIYRYPQADAEREANPGATLHPALSYF